MKSACFFLPLMVACSAEKTSETASGGVDESSWMDVGTGDGELDGDDTGTDGASDEPGNSDGDDDPTVDMEGTLELTAGSVMDPKLMGDPTLTISVTVKETDGCQATLQFTNGIGQRFSVTDPEETTEWDGRDENGHAFDPGEVSITLDASCGKAERTLDQTMAYIVRISPTTIDLSSPEDESGHVGLAFHKKSLLDVNISPVGDRAEYKQDPVGVLGSAIDRDDGTP